MSEPTLEYTVHHKGRRYLAGQTAEEIGPVAGEFGDHVWVDGKAPAKSAIPAAGSPDGGVYAATPRVPQSGLPGGFDGQPDKELATVLRIEGGDNTPGTGPGQTGEDTGAPDLGEPDTDGGGTSTPPAAKKAAAPKKATGSGA